MLIKFLMMESSMLYLARTQRALVYKDVEKDLEMDFYGVRFLNLGFDHVQNSWLDKWV